MPASSAGGFPHSDIPGSRDICSSPGLFAAYHVFHRLSVPRHPPCALSCLTGSGFGLFLRVPAARMYSVTSPVFGSSFFWLFFTASRMSISCLRFFLGFRFLYAVFKVHDWYVHSTKLENTSLCFVNGLARSSSVALRLLLTKLLSANGDGEIRTLDPLLARQVLSQLSYTPIVIRHPPALPCRLQHSTIGRLRLNRRVRDGYGCLP